MMRKLFSLFLFIQSCLCFSHAKPRWIFHSLPRPVGVYYSFYLDRLCSLFILLSQPDWLLLCDFNYKGQYHYYANPIWPLYQVFHSPGYSVVL